MLKTLLFDLDGTLLPIDTDRFVSHYLKALAAHIGHLVPPDLLAHQIMASTHAMITNTDPTLTNAQVFAADFFPKVQRTEEEMMPLFDAFYLQRFPSLRSACPSLPGLGRAVVAAALQRGYEIVLATNPLFPREAIEERMRWVGVFDLPWRLVTCYEEMHSCKPQPAFYSEVLERIGRRPDECLMIGNDLEEDGAAQAVGLPVYFVTDFLISRSGNPAPGGRSSSLEGLLVKLQAGRLDDLL